MKCEVGEREREREREGGVGKAPQRPLPRRHCGHERAGLTKVRRTVEPIPQSLAARWGTPWTGQQSVAIVGTFSITRGGLRQRGSSRHVDLHEEPLSPGGDVNMQLLRILDYFWIENSGVKVRHGGAGGYSCNADWMGSLCPALTSMPLRYLAVPGSHDSFSFWVDEEAPVGPDQTAVVKHLAVVFRLLAKKVMKKWSMTQSLTFRQQLDGGIRYFDLRVASKPGEPGYEVYFIHGLFGHRVRDGLGDIDTFLSEHPKEVVFLDFNHHYAMNEDHHRYLIATLQEVFGPKLCRVNAVEEITLDYLWKHKYQVIVFYHHPCAATRPFLWPGSKIPAPWANTTDACKLIQFLETTLGEREQYGTFHVSQAILTPRVKTIARGLIQGLRDHLVERNLPTIMTWVEAQKPGVNGVNIITSDFVELVDFASTVIKLNNLLLPNLALM
ncbi:PI-PLC X domain-containing protein 2-like [Arapaima gigas]